MQPHAEEIDNLSGRFKAELRVERNSATQNIDGIEVHLLALERLNRSIAD